MAILQISFLISNSIHARGLIDGITTGEYRLLRDMIFPSIAFSLASQRTIAFLHLHIRIVHQQTDTSELHPLRLLVPRERLHVKLQYQICQHELQRADREEATGTVRRRVSTRTTSLNKDSTIKTHQACFPSPNGIYRPEICTALIGPLSAAFVSVNFSLPSAAISQYRKGRKASQSSPSPAKLDRCINLVCKATCEPRGKYVPSGV